MTTTTTETAGIEFKVGATQSTVNFNGAETFAIASGGDVTAFADNGVQTKPAEAAPAQTGDYLVAITPDLKSAALSGAKVTLTSEEPLVSTDGSVRIRPAAEGANTDACSVEFKVEKDLTTLNIEDTKFEVAPNSDVTVYLKEGEGVQTKPADEHVAGTDAADPSVRISPEFNAAVAYGARVKVTADGPVVSTNGKVRIKPATPVVEVAAVAAVATETPAASAVASEAPAAAVNAPLEIGGTDRHGCVYLGNSTGRPLFVASKDSGVLTYDETKKATAEARRYQGIMVTHLPTKAEMKVIAESERKGLVDGFNKTGNGYDSRYWTSTKWAAGIFPGQKVTQGFADNDKVRSNGHKSIKHNTRLVHN